eukprot:TRINITY_DN5167_c0_g1_i9.p4 TRINITY_DN5167_c0_g1~~TRINITY_DN5167_c0_g1_i9.p4  ORF type:complete len:104 (-),score=22.09 TRINITY_DN5167_c0_g1_i9:490-801(-)
MGSLEGEYKIAYKRKAYTQCRTEPQKSLSKVTYLRSLVADYVMWKDTYRTLVLLVAMNFTFILAVAFKMAFISIVCDFLFVYIFLGIVLNFLVESLGYSAREL